MKRFEGKVAIVTGAGSVGPGWGNGRATAVRFAEEGARVLAVDRDLDRLAETLERAGEFRASIRSAQCDVTDARSVAAMVAEATQVLGRIDVLVNNVGGSAPGGPVEMSEEVFDAQVDYNLKSVFLTCKHVLPVMEQQRAGAIVNVSSTSALRWTGAAHVAYAATKAGIIQFSRVVAVQYAPKGIRVNCVVPGQLHTPMVEARLAGQRAGGDVEKLLRDRLARIPLGFMGDGRDTAAAAAFLASDDARSITGTEIVVDGGMIARAGSLRGRIRARGSELRRRRRLRFSSRRERRNVTRDAALPGIETLASLEAGQAAHDHFARGGEIGKLLAHRGNRQMHLLGDLRIEPLAVFSQAVQHFNAHRAPGRRRCRARRRVLNDGHENAEGDAARRRAPARLCGGT